MADQSYISEQLQELTEKVQRARTKGPNEAKQETITQLYNDYLQAKETLDTAPMELADAERNYYMALDGGSMYAAKIKSDFHKSQPEIQRAFDLRMNAIDDQIKTLQTLSDTGTNVYEQYLIQLNQLIAKVNDSNLYKNAIALDNRKTYYLSQGQTSVALWSSRVTLMFITMSLVQLALFARDKNKKRLPWVIVPLVCWGLSTLVYKWLQKFMNQENIYTAMGERWIGYKI